MTRIDTIDDSKWVEVKLINGYAVFMGYLLMGVRGLGVLVITWTTVVLLGGFVSVLGTKDFWCLTGITLVQTAGVFNFLLEETVNDFVHSFWGLLGAALATAIKQSGEEKEEELSTPWAVLVFALSVIQALVLATVLCPVAVLYLCGMYISAGLSLWRLIEHDFSNPDGGANLKPALQVLYILAVVQGVLFSYKKLHGVVAKFKLAEAVAVGTHVNKSLIADYIEGTVAGCERDPSFANGRNLVTYGIGLMVEAKSNGGFIAGISVLGTVIDGDLSGGRKVVAKHLLISSPSFTHMMIQRLLEILGPRSPYSGEIREHAVRIVALVAHSILLEQCPGGIQCISSLLDTFEEYSFQPEGYTRDSRLPRDYDRDWLLEKDERDWLLLQHGYYSETRESNTLHRSDSEQQQHKELVLQGFSILQKLADREDNCRVIINTEGLLDKITRSGLHMDRDRDDNTISDDLIQRKSLNLMYQLAAVPGEVGTKSRSEISRMEKAIISILEDLQVGVYVKICTVEILLHLSVDTSTILASGSNVRRIFTWILLIVFVFTDNYNYFATIYRSHLRMKKRSDITRLAGEKLSDLVSSNQDLSNRLTLQRDKGSATSMLRSIHLVLEDLTGALLDSGNISNRVNAAKILRLLCHDHLRADDEYLKELKEAIVHVMPQVLKEVLFGYVSTREAVPTVVREANNVQSSSHDIIDLGSGDGNAQQNTSQQQKDEQPEDKKLREELVNLCWTLRWWDDRELALQLDAIASKVCSEHGKPVENFRGFLTLARGSG